MGRSKGLPLTLISMVRRPSSAVYAAWMGAASVLVWRAWDAAAAPAFDHFADLHVYYGAVREMVAGHGLYDFKAANGDPFTYPPAAGVLLAPLAFLDEWVVQVVWLVLEVVALFFLVRCVTRLIPTPRLLPSRAVPPLVFLAFAISAPVGSNLRFGQLSLFITVACAITFLNNRSGVWMGMAAGAKLIPLAFIPVLLVWRRKAGVVASLTFVTATTACWVLLPEESRRYWLHDLPMGTKYGDSALIGNQSLMGVLLRHPAWPGHALTILMLLAGPILAAGTWRAVKMLRSGSRLGAFVVSSGVGILLSPVSWTHHQIPLVVATFCISTGTKWLTWALRALVIVLMSVNVSVIATLSFPGSFLFGETRFLLCVYLVFLAIYRTDQDIENETSLHIGTHLPDRSVGVLRDVSA